MALDIDRLSSRLGCKGFRGHGRWLGVRLVSSRHLSRPLPDVIIHDAFHETLERPLEDLSYGLEPQAPTCEPLSRQTQRSCRSLRPLILPYRSSGMRQGLVGQTLGCPAPNLLRERN